MTDQSSGLLERCYGYGWIQQQQNNSVIIGALVETDIVKNSMPRCLLAYLPENIGTIHCLCKNSFVIVVTPNA
jgi:hypothetical protein